VALVLGDALRRDDLLRAGCHHAHSVCVFTAAGMLEEADNAAVLATAKILAILQREATHSVPLITEVRVTPPRRRPILRARPDARCKPHEHTSKHATPAVARRRAACPSARDTCTHTGLLRVQVRHARSVAYLDPTEWWPDDETDPFAHVQSPAYASGHALALPRHLPRARRRPSGCLCPSPFSPALLQAHLRRVDALPALGVRPHGQSAALVAPDATSPRSHLATISPRLTMQVHVLHAAHPRLHACVRRRRPRRRAAAAVADPALLPRGGAVAKKRPDVCGGATAGASATATTTTTSTSTTTTTTTPPQPDARLRRRSPPSAPFLAPPV